jgi:hypothetical protein
MSLRKVFSTILDSDPRGVGDVGDSATIRCPAHDDETPSLSVTLAGDKILLKCHAGCKTEDVLRALGLGWEDLFAKGSRPTLEGLAAVKKLPLKFLKKLKLEDFRGGIVIPYWDGNGDQYVEADGKPFSRYRTSLFGGGKVKSRKGSKSKVYGLFMRPLWKKHYLVLVEGESDCWALWYHYIPAYGLPGSANVKPLKGGHLSGFDRIYVIQEPDRAGASFVKNVCNRLRRINFQGKVFRLGCGNFKDPSELHCADPDKFRERWEALLARAEPLDLDETAARKPSKIEALVELGLRQSKILLDEDSGMAIAQVKDDGVLVHYPVCSRDYQRWLMRGAGAVVRTQDVKEAVANLAVRYTDKVKTYCRVARVGDVIYYDLGSGKVVEITASGWTVVDNPPVVFVRGKDYGHQVEPSPGGNIKKDLAGLVNVADEGLALLIAWFLDALKGQKPFTILSVHGPQGRGKSCARHVIKSLVDPGLKLNGLSLPETARDLAILAKNRYLVDFDNVSRFSPDISDALCRLSTGSGFSVRKLYTDDDEAIFGGANPVCFNGIPEFVERPDLQDRVITLNLKRIEDKDRKDEASLAREFNRLRPSLLGALFDLVANGLRNLDQIPRDGGPRMLDTYRWLLACQKGTDLDLAGNYRRHVDDSLGALAEGDLLVQTLRRVLEASGGKWSGSATALYNAVVQRWPSDTRKEERQCPGAPNILTNRLTQMEEAMQKLGIRIKTGRKHKGRIIEIDATAAPEVQEAVDREGD